MSKTLLAVAAALAALGSGTGAQAQQPAAPDYSKPSAWICLPGRSDTCSAPLPTTRLTPAGYAGPVEAAPAADPPIDCFYVYPTMSRDPGLNSDLNVDEEKVAVQNQFARFSSVCRTYAPIYRQMTLASVAAAAAGADLLQPAALAYSDVAAAWRTYLSTYNRGRPFVLIGHSQGSLMLQQLISREIEGKPVARQLVRAIIPGFNVLVPQGKLVGGTFQSIPLCSSAGETGCVMAWSSYRDGSQPPDGAMFGMAPQPGMTVGCTNPAAPGSTQWQPLDSDWDARAGLPVPGGPITWSSEGPPPTRYVSTSGLVSGRCVTDGPRGYLSIRTNHVPGAKWTDHVGGEVGLLGIFLPGWGMHLSDMAEAEGDLIRQVGELGDRSRTIARPAH